MLAKCGIARNQVVEAGLREQSFCCVYWKRGAVLSQEKELCRLCQRVSHAAGLLREQGRKGCGCERFAGSPLQALKSAAQPVLCVLRPLVLGAVTEGCSRRACFMPFVSRFLK